MENSRVGRSLAEAGEPVKIERKGHAPLVRNSFPMPAFDEAAASWAGREDARLARRGIIVACEDLQIAAIAVVGRLALVTEDTAFRPFAERSVVDWTKAA